LSDREGYDAILRALALDVRAGPQAKEPLIYCRFLLGS
jgi:hypothetical protein